MITRLPSDYENVCHFHKGCDEWVKHEWCYEYTITGDEKHYHAPFSELFRCIGCSLTAKWEKVHPRAISGKLREQLIGSKFSKNPELDELGGYYCHSCWNETLKRNLQLFEYYKTRVAIARLKHEVKQCRTQSKQPANSGNSFANQSSPSATVQ